MNPALIIPIIQGLASLVKDLTPVAQSLIGNLQSEDQEKLQSALSDLQAAVDAQRAETSALLQGR